MLPSILAKQLQKGLSDFFKTTFPMTTPLFKESMQRLLDTKDSVFHDPYVSVRLPFRVANDMPANFFPSIDPKYKPYVHQQRAFERLTGQDGRSTLIATGTGSGKTECFLYPILQYCYNNRGVRGIKALIIYPMNALAADQAKRIAELIHTSPALRGNITAGMYVGGHDGAPNRAMTNEKIITDRETMLSSPPDILLTNYKMLDYLLVRPKDASLWKDNSPETLKYIAVDELHTFNGAQGTDLACLLRRLKSRLFAPVGHLCCIGTSATMGDKDSAAGIIGYASEIFGEPFEDGAVVTEDRLSAYEFFEGKPPIDFTMPDKAAILALQASVEQDDQRAFLEAAAKAWLDESFTYTDILSGATRLALGARLSEHAFTQELLTYIAGKFVQNDTVCENFGGSHPELRGVKGAELAIDALYALISHARTGTVESLRPFLNVQVQLWFRELVRLLAKVDRSNVTYALATDLNEQQAATYLPVINCRDCGETGWVSVKNERGNVQITDLGAFYNLYFVNDSKVAMLYPSDHESKPNGMVEAFLCPNCMQLDVAEGQKHFCSSCGADQIPVIMPLRQQDAGKHNRGFRCPHCGSLTGLFIIGLRSATAISATISQLFASKFNDDKKTLAFSDNVQDAAHRAGFFNSRTWKSSLRSAIQKFVLDEGDGMNFREFEDRFVSYWHEKLSDEQFVSRFIAPNLTWMRAFENMKREGVFAHGYDENNLMKNIELRLRYELMLEYGLLSRIGRTLKKSGCSVISFADADVSEVVGRVLERAVNEIGGASGQFSEDLFGKIVIGFLNLMASNGAFNDKVFNAFTRNNGQAYLLSNDREKWLPGLQFGRNTPRFIYQPTDTTKKRLPNFDALGGKGIYFDWFYKCLGDKMPDSIKGEEIAKTTYEEIAKIIFEELRGHGLVAAMPTPTDYNAWGLSKDKAFISADVRQFACEICGHSLSVSAENARLWEGAPCLRKNCCGKLHVLEGAELGYFGKLYSSGDIVRISAKEHTGLLERDDREELERVFKRGGAEHKPWDTNVISCTPTLELGIDIGDLSSVILCSVPPGRSQYLQRTGRAGRKDGNALNIAVANARPHDLYFYADPMEMMAGNVEPPKIFLKASAVLERQFIAYSMDSWIKKGIPESAIPKTLGVCINNLTTRDPAKYPFNFLNFVRGNISGLLRTFLQMFLELEEDERKDFESFAKGSEASDSPMYLRVLEAFESLKKQKNALMESVKQLKKLIKDLEKKPKDPQFEKEIKELNTERLALANVIRSINNKDVFNFLSDEGLLPNYAFPESGVILKAVLYRREDPQGGAEPTKKRYDKMVYEYSRSASAAISEFAPANNFYVDGRKLKINQIDLTSAQVAKWRLCPNCSHAQLEEALKNVAACPQCGSPAWSDQGQVRSMLKVQMVYSNMDYTKSLIGDESDDRQVTFYCKQLLVDVNEDKDIFKAYRMDNADFAFGYEFVKKATLREINFGERDIVGEQLTVAGQEEVRKGFMICKYCGKLQPQNGNPEHSYTCKAKNAASGDGAYEEYLFLYREFVTEVLRIFVPATTMDSTKVRQESFISAFMLGMKEYFGNVDHLRATISEAPATNADYRKQYLVVYDSVPGGTGYLKQLMLKQHSLIEIFEKALAVLEKCSCKEDPQKDGCYRCLYAYRQSRNIGQISRSTAMLLLKQILSGKENLTDIKKLGDVPTDGLFESELERRFIEALSHMGNQSRKLMVNKELVRGKEGYLLKIGNAIWEIEPQVELDAKDGVSVETRADFVLWPTKSEGNPKPVVIYTDGFLYHKNKVADDTLKREAIRRSGKFRVWSLSWKDVQSVFKAQGDYATNALNALRMPSYNTMYNKTVGDVYAEALKPDKMPPMELLAQYLENPEAEQVFSAHAVAIAFSLLEPTNMTNSVIFADWNLSAQGIIEALGLDAPTFDFGKSFFGIWKPRSSNAHMTVYSGVLADDMRNNKRNAYAVVFSVLDDSEESRTEKYEAEWNGFWQFFNVMQFLKNFSAVSEVGLKNTVYSRVPLTPQTPQEAPAPGGAVGWPPETLEQIFDAFARAFAIRCAGIGIPAPDIIGYELIGESGQVIGEAEMAWERFKVAFLLDEQSESREAFQAVGWVTVFIDDEIQTDWFKEGE
jgi:DEAD/DEAH box helicase domain-containing protein